jgi:hypothetical protein
LKPLSDSGYFPSKSSSKGTKTLKPYQGLKQHFVINVIVGRAWHKNPKTLLGIETTKHQALLLLAKRLKAPKTLLGIEISGRS